MQRRSWESRSRIKRPSVAVGDFDNDGWSDLFLVRAGNPAMPTEQIVLLNQQGKSFAVAANAGVVSKELGAVGGGAEAFDYNEDGKLDLIYANERGRWHLFTNNGVAAGGQQLRRRQGGLFAPRGRPRPKGRS